MRLRAPAADGAPGGRNRLVISAGIAIALHGT
jgi:hypothetical protein